MTQDRNILDVTGDPEVVDLQVAALLISLSEQCEKVLGNTMATALRYAAHRLLEMWILDESEDADVPDPDDGPCSLNTAESPHPTPGPETTEIMFG